jgi:hypothetical protein
MQHEILFFFDEIWFFQSILLRCYAVLTLGPA